MSWIVFKCLKFWHGWRTREWKRLGWLKQKQGRFHMLISTGVKALPLLNICNCLGPIWYHNSNTYFQFLNITRISTLFHSHVFSHMFSNTYFQFLSACTKHPLSFIAITLQLQMLSKDPYILLPYLLNISLSCSPLIVLIRLLAAYIVY